MPVHPPYSPPPDAPVRFTFRMIAAMLCVPVIAVVLFLLVPDSPVVVSLLTLAILLVVGGSIGYSMLRRHDLEEPPRRQPDPHA